MQEIRNSAVTTQQAARWHAHPATGAAQITHLCCPPPSAELLISFTPHSPRNILDLGAKLGSFGCLTLLGGIQPKSKQIRKVTGLELTILARSPHLLTLIFTNGAGNVRCVWDQWL
jgi:hypothetical protein